MRSLINNIFIIANRIANGTLTIFSVNYFVSKSLKLTCKVVLYKDSIYVCIYIYFLCIIIMLQFG